MENSDSRDGDAKGVATADLQSELASLTPAQRQLLLERLKQRRAESTLEEKPSAIGAADHGGEAPLSAEQRRLWFLQRLQPASSALNFPIAVRLRGEFDPGVLAASLNDLSARHEILRTVFPERADGPIQKILAPDHTVGLALEDARAAQDAMGRARELVATSIATPFDLQHETPVRALLIRTAASEHVLLLLFHHIATDEWAAAKIVEELSELRASLGSELAVLGLLRVQAHPREVGDPVGGGALGLEVGQPVVVVAERVDAGPVEMAMSQDTLTGFLAWVESSPPGTRTT